MKISVGIPHGKLPTMLNMLNKERSLARNIKDDSTREQVEKGLRSIINRAKAGKLYWFDGELDSLETQDYDSNAKIYECGKEFVQPPAKPTSTYLMIAIDANECTVGLLKGKQVTTLWHETSNVPNHHKNGGYSAARFQRGRDEAKKQWYRKCARKIKELVETTHG